MLQDTAARKGSSAPEKQSGTAPKQGRRLPIAAPQPYNPLESDDTSVYDPLRGADHYAAQLAEGKEVYISENKKPATATVAQDEWKNKYFALLEK